MRRILAAVLFTLGVTLAAPHAQMMQAIVNDVHQSAGGGYTGPADVLASPIEFWGLRAVSGAYATSNGSLADWKCTNSGAHTGTLVADATTGGPTAASVSTMTTACGVATISVTKLYGQVGSVPLTDNGGTSPVLTANCIGSFYCLAFAPSLPNSFDTGATAIARAQPFTFSVVAMRTGAFTTTAPFAYSVTNLVAAYYNSSTNTVGMSSNSGFPTAAASDGVVHAFQFAFNGASSVIKVDATSSTVSPGGSAMAGAAAMSHSGSGYSLQTGDTFEFGVWPVANTTLCPNQHTYYGTATSC